MPCNAWLTIGDAVTLAIYSDPACPAAAGCLGSPEEAVALQCRFCKRGAAGPANCGDWLRNCLRVVLCHSS